MKIYLALYLIMGYGAFLLDIKSNEEFIMCDYIYKTTDDEFRFKIFKVYEDDTCYYHWDVDVWDKETGGVWTFGVEEGDCFNKKSDAKSWIQQQYGKVVSINPERVTEGW